MFICVILFQVNAFNIGYSDNGLFGIYAISGNSDVDTVSTKTCSSLW